MIPSCIICKKQIKPLYEGEHTPEYATTFHTSGHDGSGLFDPMDGSFLQINICDNCLAAAAEQDLVLVGQSSVPLMIPTMVRADHWIYSGWGSIRAFDYAPVYWKKSMESPHEPLYVSDADELLSLKDRIQFNGRLTLKDAMGSIAEVEELQDRQFQEQQEDK